MKKRKTYKIKRRANPARKGKEHFSFKNEYKKCFLFLKDSKNFIYSAILLFLIFTAIGFFFDDIINFLFNSILGINLDEKILFYLQELLLQTEGMNTQQLISFIFLNNLQSSFSGMIFGIFFGLVPLIGIITNGYILGFVALLVIKANGAGVLWRILPHGIFELPAIFISLGLGLRLGMFVFREKESYSFKNIFVNSLRVFLLIILPLLIIAAIIEGALIVLGG